MAGPSINTSKSALVEALKPFGQKTLDKLEKLFTWLNTEIISDGVGGKTKLSEDQETSVINYARYYFEAKKLITGDIKAENIDSLGIQKDLDVALEDLNKEIVFSQCQEIFEDAITKLPNANHKELAESLESLMKIFSNDFDKSEPKISLAEFKEELVKAKDVAKYFKDNISKLETKDRDLLEKHIETISSITLLNPGLTVIQKAASQKEINAFVRAAAKAAKPDTEQSLDAEAKTKIFKENNPKIGDIIIQGQSLMNKNPNFNLESFYTSELSKLNIPASAMKEIIATVQTHHKKDNPKANNESKDFISNIAQELMESVPYMALQAVIGLCSSFLHYIPFIGGTAANFIQGAGSIVANRAMGHAMHQKREAPAPAKATPA